MNHLRDSARRCLHNALVEMDRQDDHAIAAAQQWTCMALTALFEMAGNSNPPKIPTKEYHCACGRRWLPGGEGPDDNGVVQTVYGCMFVGLLSPLSGGEPHRRPPTLGRPSEPVGNLPPATAGLLSGGRPVVDHYRIGTPCPHCGSEDTVYNEANGWWHCHACDASHTHYLPVAAPPSDTDASGASPAPAHAGNRESGGGKP